MIQSQHSGLSTELMNCSPRKFVDDRISTSQLICVSTSGPEARWWQIGSFFLNNYKALCEWTDFAWLCYKRFWIFENSLSSQSVTVFKSEFKLTLISQCSFKRGSTSPCCSHLRGTHTVSNTIVQFSLSATLRWHLSWMAGWGHSIMWHHSFTWQRAPAAGNNFPISKVE